MCIYVQLCAYTQPENKADAKSKNIGKENCFNPSHAKYWAGNHARKGRDGEAADKKGKI